MEFLFLNWRDRIKQVVKMKKSIIIGIFITSILLIITPTIQANEYHQIKKSHIILLENNLQAFLIKLNNLYDQIKKPVMNNEILSNENYLPIINIIKNRYQLIDQINNGEINISNQSIFNLIISLIFAFIGTIIGIVFGPFIALIVSILTAPAVILAKLIEFIVNIIFTLINLY
jgi:hypothetical protein